ncbi:hypothetical protein CONPUDRAFT_166903 [Coniophora puteana RWD-64-598 SS2]|uniref:PHD-type domain-containing protein n=1 Tax=Coniophora puteana (strain RWD-64-598) TaxID=741705 RepID=A0A5M3MIN3_CONPW|nr:uncharacterized protein CONPUDRAFT_166903 [Coniophora puteana RWD-64-598 SS2]EIW79072.1 hypothetical protein CONPUDRAFT_166903 [Coniophora puteana RWD-64-598 SS2]
MTGDLLPATPKHQQHHLPPIRHMHDLAAQRPHPLRDSPPPPITGDYPASVIHGWPAHDHPQPSHRRPKAPSEEVKPPLAELAALSARSPRSPVPHINSTFMHSSSPRRPPSSQSQNAHHKPPSHSFPASSTSQLGQPSLSAQAPEHGGEIGRVRAQMVEGHGGRSRDGQPRRPDSLKRTARSPSLHGEDRQYKNSPSQVGTMESPARGRRLLLFQETSDESFEESLMAGGYGPYRSDPSRPSELAEPAVIESGRDRAPLTPAESRKRQRLAAFASPPSHAHASTSRSALQAIQLEGIGRVLVTPTLSEAAQQADQPPPKRKRHRRKKGSQDIDEDAGVADGAGDVPNWPDAEFPWRLQGEVRDGLTNAEREERMRYIEMFFDRASDESDDEEPEETDEEWRRRMGRGGEDGDGLEVDGKEQQMDTDEGVLDDDALQPHSRSQSQHQQLARPPRMGLGKMYPLAVHTAHRNFTRRTRNVVPSDPADARTALMSKRAVRALTVRHARRRTALPPLSSLAPDFHFPPLSAASHHSYSRRPDGADRRRGEDDERLCVCRGVDDGRELVQCDRCLTWYHLECLGIGSIDELGREEDPWFCPSCETASIASANPTASRAHARARAQASPRGLLPALGPALVPSAPPSSHHHFRSVSEVYDPLFFKPDPAHIEVPSPLGVGGGSVSAWSPAHGPPRTPPRGTAPGHFSSGTSSWGPETPRTGDRIGGGGGDGRERDTVRVWTGSSSPAGAHGHGLGLGLEHGHGHGHGHGRYAVFDPTSTPSRGIQFGGPAAYATPKDGPGPGPVWHSRGALSDSWRTPSQVFGSGGARSGGGSGSGGGSAYMHSGSGSGSGGPPRGRYSDRGGGGDDLRLGTGFTPAYTNLMPVDAYDDTPIGRAYHALPGHVLDSPLAGKRGRRTAAEGSLGSLGSLGSAAP